MAVGQVGLEPTCFAAQHFKCRVYTNSTTSPNCSLLIQLRSRPELNRSEGFCRPVPNHSATRPFFLLCSV